MLASNDTGALDTNISTHSSKGRHPYMAVVRPESAIKQIPGARKTCSEMILAGMSEEAVERTETAEETVARLEKDAALIPGARKTCSEIILPEMSEEAVERTETAEEKLARLEKDAALWRDHVKKDVIMK